MKTLVIYHKADWDGIFSREICRRFYRDKAEYLGWDYGNPVPVVEPGREVVMVDISVDGLMDHRPLIWIDHHASAMAKFSPEIRGYRIDGVAACRLAWQWFFTGNVSRNPTLETYMTLPDKQAFIDRKVVEPYAVRLAGEYDIWDKRDPDADVFQQALRSRPLDDDYWANLLNASLHPDTNTQRSELTARALMPGGHAIQFSSDEANASLMRDCAFKLDWEGLSFLAVNKPRGNSRTFAAAVNAKDDALMTFYWSRNKWRVSLYHAPHNTGIDLSKIAVKYGGGGHRGACGFECGVLPFQLFREKPEASA